MQKVLAFLVILIPTILYFSWDTDWFQSNVFPEEYWSKEIDKKRYQIAYTIYLVEHERDSRTNNQSLMKSTYTDCIYKLFDEEKHIESNYSKYLNGEDRTWVDINLEPRINEYVSDSIDKIQRKIIGHEEWFFQTHKKWLVGKWTDRQYREKKSQFCEGVFEREEELFKFASAAHSILRTNR